MELPNIRRILCPTDFSHGSSLAFEHALGLARLYDAEIELLHAHPLVAAVVGDLTYTATIVRLDGPTRRRLTEDLGTLVVRAHERGIAAKATLVEGDPSREILQIAQATGSDLIVMGTTGRRGLERWMLGSVAESVLLRADCPVLTVGAGHEDDDLARRPAGGESGTDAAPGSLVRGAGLESILCPLDLREHSVAILKRAVSLSRKAQAPLTVLHVLEGIVEVAGPGESLSWPHHEGYRRFLETRARGRLRSIIRAATGDSVGIGDRVVAGHVQKEILRAADELGSSLIVMGLHGGHPLAMLLFGSTTQHLVRAARCPVLTVGTRSRTDTSEPARLQEVQHLSS